MALLPNALSCLFHSPIQHKRSPDRSGKTRFIPSPPFLYGPIPPPSPNPKPKSQSLSLALSCSLSLSLSFNSGTSFFSLKPTSPRELLV
uniref:Uncharacterized protein n=1 Tax=Monodon monoceros TaxID=40151 RepID=A0A8C6B074_MONMO